MFSMIVDSEVYERIVIVTCLFLLYYCQIVKYNNKYRQIVFDFKISPPFKLK